jgi:hypothetical protein
MEKAALEKSLAGAAGAAEVWYSADAHRQLFPRQVGQPALPWRLSPAIASYARATIQADSLMRLDIAKMAGKLYRHAQEAATIKIFLRDFKRDESTRSNHRASSA